MKSVHFCNAQIILDYEKNIKKIEKIKLRPNYWHPGRLAENMTAVHQTVAESLAISSSRM